MRAGGGGYGRGTGMNAPEEQDNISGKAYDLKLALRLWRFLRPHRKIFFLSLLLLPVHQGFNLAQPLLLKIGIDAVSAGDGLTLMTAGLLFAGALAAEATAYFFQYYLSMKVAQRCLADLRVTLFSHVQRLPMSYFDKNPVGRLMTRMTTDVEVLQEMFAAGAMNLVADLVRMAVIKQADEILVLDDGRIVERGDHESLLRAGGPYARMYRRQQMSDELEEL